MLSLINVCSYMYVLLNKGFELHLFTDDLETKINRITTRASNSQSYTEISQTKPNKITYKGFNTIEF